MSGVACPRRVALVTGGATASALLKGAPILRSRRRRSSRPRRAAGPRQHADFPAGPGARQGAAASPAGRCSGGKGGGGPSGVRVREAGAGAEPGGEVIALSGAVLLVTNKSGLLPGAQAKLTQVAAALTSQDTTTGASRSSRRLPRSPDPQRASDPSERAGAQPAATPKALPMAAVTPIARAPPTVTRSAARPMDAPPR